MDEKIVSFEVAKKLKELGFDEPCNYFYLDTGSLMQQRAYSNSEESRFSYYKSSQLYAAPDEKEYNKWMDNWIKEQVDKSLVLYPIYQDYQYLTTHTGDLKKEEYDMLSEEEKRKYKRHEIGDELHIIRNWNELKKIEDKLDESFKWRVFYYVIEKYESLYSNYLNLFSKIYCICSYLGVKTADTNRPEEILEKSEEMVRNIKKDLLKTQSLKTLEDYLQGKE